MQFREKVQRKGIQRDAELFNEHVSLELPMKGAIARLIETSPSVALAFGQTEIGPASRVSEPPDAGKGFG